VLVVVDSPKKVSTLRTQFPGDKVISVEFPLYVRFRRGKVKLDAFPALRPSSAPEIKQLQKLAHGVDVLGVFDDTDYGRVLARDLSEALADLNNSVVFKFVRAYSPDAVAEAPTQTGVHPECDVKYVVNRFISARIDELLQEYCGDTSDLTCTWQQAYLLSCIRSGLKEPVLVDTYTDSLGRTYTGRYDASRQRVVQRTPCQVATPVLSVLDLADNVSDFESVYTALDRLRSLGLIPVAAAALSSFEDTYDTVCGYLERLGIDRGSDHPLPGYFVLDITKDVSRVPEADFVRSVYSKIKNETFLRACSSARVLLHAGSVCGLRFSHFVQERTWLPLSALPTFPECPPVVPSPEKVRRLASCSAATNADLVCAAETAGFTDRDLWSACLYLQRKQLAFRRDGKWYLTSRGVVVLHILEHAFPDVLTAGTATFVSRTVEEHLRVTNNPVVLQQEITVAAVHEYLSREVLDLDLQTMWDGFAGLPSDADVHVSAGAAWLVYRGDAYGLRLGASGPVAVETDTAVYDTCTCGCDVVNTSLSPTYETSVVCPSCGIQRPLAFFLPKD